MTTEVSNERLAEYASLIATLREQIERLKADRTAAGEDVYNLALQVAALTEQVGELKGAGWPDDAEFQYGDWVEKYTGEAIWEGRVVSAYHTKRLALRYVVEVEPQGFQMIAVPTQLRAARSIRNPSVADYMQHWEARTTTAEARVADLEALIAAQHGDVVVRTAKLLYDKVDKIAALTAERDAAMAFVPDYAPWMDKHADAVALSFYRPATFGDLRAARRVLAGGEG